MTEPVQPTGLEEDAQLSSITAPLSHFEDRNRFFPVCPEQSSQASVIEYSES